MTAAETRYGMTVPFGGPLHEQADRFRELSELGYTDAWTAEADGHDGLTPRSEEHTSELQSRTNLVCRLLLEKKKLHFIS